jgi:hypothetical protein
VIPLGHIAGIPVEEFAPAFATSGASLLVARAWLSYQLRRRDRRESEER